MLINNEIIEKLTIEQKIALLTDSTEGAQGPRELQIPTLAITELKSDAVDENDEIIFPSFSSLANSWDAELFGDVAKNQAKLLMARSKENLFVLPKANAAQSAYGEEITEDPYLAGKLLAGAAKGLTRAGATVCLQAPTVSVSDTRVMDNEADEFVLFERVLRPFKLSKSGISYEAILKEQDETKESYKIANQKMIKAAVEKNKAIFTRLENGDNTVSVINQGGQALGGSTVALQTAYDNYRRIYQSMQEGGATARELEMAILDGAAISDEIIDNALDEKITLAKKCAQGKFIAESFDMDEIAEKSTKKSIVLVKNKNKLLPLGKGKRVALFGDIISNTSNGGFVNFIQKITSYLSASGIDVIGYSRGYELDCDISKTELEEACRLADSCDVAVVFVGFGKEREKDIVNTQRLSLPANQVALISALEQLGKKTVAVICSSRLPCMSFDDATNSILLAPPQGRALASSLTDVLVGKFNPEGKLAYSGYDDIDTEFRKIQKRKKNGEQKIGQFIGYRYTDIVEKKARYPFGHGLSYTSYVYSSVNINSKNVSFTIQNVGDFEGCETTQIYLSCNSSSRQRPRKELKAMCKTSLKPGEKKNVSVTLEELGIYDSGSGKFVVESGEYTVYVASSSWDVRLNCNIQVIGHELSEGNQRISDYLHEMSNIRSESYTMEAHCKPMNKASKTKTISAWLFIITLFADIMYGVCGLLLAAPFKEQLAVFLTLNILALSIALILRIVYLVGHSKAKKKQKEEEKQATAELFKNAQKINASSLEKLFSTEFDQPEAEQAKKTVTYKGEVESIYVYMAVENDFSSLCKELEKHFEANGMVISPSLAKNVIASIMSSRLLVLRNKDEAVTERFSSILASFFGTAALVESQEGRNWESETLLYTNTAMGINQRTLVQAIHNANAENQSATFYVMKDVSLNDTASFLMPYVQFLGNPLEAYKVTENGTSYEIPSNLWFVIIPDGSQSIDSLPAFIANLASVIDLDVEKTGSASESVISNAKPISAQQMEALKYRSRKAISIDEQIWKSVDSLEEFVNERAPYHIGNKVFLQLESYVSVYLSSGGASGEAVDGMLSSKLLPAILSITKGNAQMQEVDFIQTIESIFGEEYVERSSKLIKNPIMNIKEDKPLAQESDDKALENAQESEAAQNEQQAPKTKEKTEEGDASNAE